MEQKKNTMASVSMVLGILSIVLACCCCIGFPIGSLAVLFACLSKVDYYMEGKAKTGLITGIIGMCLGVVSCILWVVLIASSSSGSHDSAYYGSVSAIRFLTRGGLL